MKKHIKITLKIENSRWSFSLLLTLGLYAESPVPTFFLLLFLLSTSSENVEIRRARESGLSPQHVDRTLPISSVIS